MVDAIQTQVKGAKQTIIVPVKGTKIYNSVTVNADKADEFLSENKKISKNIKIASIITPIVTTLLGRGIAYLTRKNVSPVDKCCIGGLIGMMAGCLGDAGRDIYGDNKINKLTDKFVKENA